MKLAIIGATGNIGKQVTNLALKQGHTVTAFARSLDKLMALEGQLNIVQGDALETNSLNDAIKGQDAVICTLGMPLMNKDGLRALGTKNIIAAMERAQVNRLICLSWLGTGDSRKSLPAFYRFLLIPLLMKRLIADHERQESYIKGSNLDWSIIRAASFSKNNPSKAYWHGTDAKNNRLSFKISHADVAEFILMQLDNDRYLGKTPGISYRAAA